MSDKSPEQSAAETVGQKFLNSTLGQLDQLISDWSLRKPEKILHSDASDPRSAYRQGWHTAVISVLENGLSENNFSPEATMIAKDYIKYWKTLLPQKQIDGPNYLTTDQEVVAASEAITAILKTTKHDETVFRELTLYHLAYLRYQLHHEPQYRRSRSKTRTNMDYQRFLGMVADIDNLLSYGHIPKDIETQVEDALRSYCQFSIPYETFDPLPADIVDKINQTTDLIFTSIPHASTKP